MGFKRINETVNGQAVYKKGSQYISRDVDGHNGGAWKVADSVKILGQKIPETELLMLILVNVLEINKCQMIKNRRGYSKEKQYDIL